MADVIGNLAFGFSHAPTLQNLLRLRTYSLPPTDTLIMLAGIDCGAP